MSTHQPEWIGEIDLKRARFSQRLAKALLIIFTALPMWAQTNWNYGTNVISAGSGVSVGLGTSSPADALQIVGGNIRMDSGHAIQLSGGTGNSFIVKDTSTNILRMLNFQASWNDNTLSSFFQMGQSAGMFTGTNGNTLSRFGIMSTGTLITDSFYESAPPPASLFHLYSSANNSILTNQAGGSGSISSFRNTNNNGDTFDFRLNGTGLSSEPGAAQIGISTTNPIEFWQSGVERMRIASTGYVGIGTSSPANLLDVRGAMNLGTVGTAGTINFARPSDGTYQATLAWRDNSTFRQYFAGGSSSYRISSYNGGEVDLLTVQTGGNVGIGTGNPASLLHLASASTAGTQFNIQSADTGGRTWALLSSASATTGGAGKLMIGDLTAGAQRMAIDTAGNIGVGTVTPLARWHVQNYSTGISFTPNGRTAAVFEGSSLGTVINLVAPAGSTQSEVWFGRSTQEIAGRVRYDHSVDALSLWTSNAQRLTINSSGNVGVGTTSPSYLLSVNGTIGTKEVVVTTTGWSDYVFHPNYRLLTLGEVAAYIAANHHLPDIPSEAEVQEKGIGLGEMQAKLLAKIEELTLHMIQADEKSTRLEQENRELQTRVAQLEARRQGLQ